MWIPEAGYVFDTADKPARLSDKTICMVARQGESGEFEHYDVHSLYGWSETEPTLRWDWVLRRIY